MKPRGGGASRGGRGGRGGGPSGRGRGGMRGGRGARGGRGRGGGMRGRGGGRGASGDRSFRGRSDLGPAKAGTGTITKKAPIRKKMRDIKRLLSQAGLPEEVRKAKEEQMKVLEEELKQVRVANRAKKYQRKYKMVKFFETQKLLRRCKKLRTKLHASPNEEKAELEKKLAAAREDLWYIKFYPPEEKYISIITEMKDAAVLAKRDEIKKRVLELVQEKIRNGEDVNVDLQPKQKKKQAKQPPQQDEDEQGESEAGEEEEEDQEEDQEEEPDEDENEDEDEDEDEDEGDEADKNEADDFFVNN